MEREILMEEIGWHSVNALKLKEWFKTKRKWRYSDDDWAYEVVDITSKAVEICLHWFTSSPMDNPYCDEFHEWIPKSAIISIKI